MSPALGQLLRKLVWDRAASWGPEQGSAGGRGQKAADLAGEGAHKGTGFPAGWPILLGLTGIPAALQLLLLPFFPESPRYLLIQKKDEAAAKNGTALPGGGALLWGGGAGDGGRGGPARGSWDPRAHPPAPLPQR